jgi:hypothetical protein
MLDRSVLLRDQDHLSERETIEWLLSGDPSIRWQTKRDPLGCPPDEVRCERAKVATTGWGRRLLDCHGPGGHWGGGLYIPKWTSTTYTLLLLRDCGLKPGHACALRGVELLWDGSRFFDGGLTAAVQRCDRDADGTSGRDSRWPVQHKHAGRVWFDMEKTGTPCRWNTLRSLRVLQLSSRRARPGGAGDRTAYGGTRPRRSGK